MRKGFAIWLCGLTLAFGCAGSETEPPLVPLDKVEATKLSGEPLEYLPFHYRTTDASVADAAQILSDQEAWLSISSLSGGHSTFPTEGYHWYALKLSNEDARSLGVSLMVESEWWVDYKAWSVADGEDHGLEVRELKPMDVIGVRYPLVIRPKDKVTVFIRFRVKGPCLTNITYFLSSDKQGMVEERSVVMGLYIGLMILMLIYNLGFFILLRERAYLYFSCLIGAIGGLLLDEFGFWIFVEHALLQTVDTTTWLTLCFFFAGLTVNRIVFENRQSGQFTDLLHPMLLQLLLSILAVLWLLWLLSDLFILLVLTSIFHGIVGLAAVYLVWSAWRNKQPFMGNLLIALIPIALATTYVPLLRLGLLPDLIGWTYFHVTVSVFFIAVRIKR